MAANKIRQFIVAFFILLGFDMFWLGFLMKNFYDTQFSVFERTMIVWSAAIAWFLIPLGIVLFVLPLSKKISDAAKNGAFYGMILYGVYDFTNYATLAGWPLSLVFVDLLWGSFLCSITSIILYWLTKRWKQ
ncbi:MAG: DUF2177 family protein [Nanoarchaeota archaeon]|nr:DUF2177 family protein [Nanoarchaeota archaeon]